MKEPPKGDCEPLIVRQAVVDDLDFLVPLFDAYRQFYLQSSDIGLARVFLSDRLRNRDSVIFIAFAPQGAALGFTQLYPSFSSGLARRIFILNDLFVIPDARRQGVGSALLRAAADFGIKAGAARLTLSTALDNKEAQALYEQSGWSRDNVFCTYNLPLAS